MAYEINFCETKEQLKHLGEVVTGKTDGSPTGSDIATSTLSYTGQTRRTIPEIERLTLESLRLGAESRQGEYVTGVTYEQPNWTYFYNGEYWGLSDSFDVTNLPYEATQADPNNDPNLMPRSNASQSYVQDYVGSVTNYQADSIDDVIAGRTVGWASLGYTIPHKIGQVWEVTGKWVVINTPVTSIDDLAPMGTVYASDFGIPDSDSISGVTAFSAFLDALRAGWECELGVSNMLIDASITKKIPANVTLSTQSSKITSANGAEITLQGDGTSHSTTLTTPNYTLPLVSSTSNLPNVYVRGVRKFELLDAAGMQDQDLVVFHSTRKFDVAGNKQTYETQRIWQVTGNAIYIDGESLVAFEVGDDVTSYRLTEGFKFIGGEFTSNDTNTTLIRLEYFNRPEVEGPFFNDVGQGNLLMIRYCAEDRVSDVTIKSAGRPTDPEAGYGGDFGYGIIHAFSCYSKVYDCTGSEGWHSFEAADGQRDITYDNVHALADGHGFSTHEGCVSATYINCHTQARLPSINRARYIKYDGGTYTKTSEDASFGANAWEIEITGINFRNKATDPTNQSFNPAYFVDPADFPDEPQTFENKAVFKKNIFNMMSGNITLGNEFCTHMHSEDNSIIQQNGTLLYEGVNVVAKNDNLTIVAVDNERSVVTQMNPIQVTYSNSAHIKNFNLHVKPSGFTQLDLIGVFSDGLLGPDKPLIIEGGTLLVSGCRYFLRSYVSQANDLHVRYIGNSHIKDKSTADNFGRTTGYMTVDFHKNYFDVERNPSYIYSDANLTINSAYDYYQNLNTFYTDGLPTDPAGIDVGCIYNDGGTLKVKLV